MTGYGKGEVVFGEKMITAEIRSLNSKQLDLSVRIPPVYRQCEYDLRNTISKKLLRGKVDAYFSYEDSGDSNVVAINRSAFESYFNQLNEIADANSINLHDSEMASGVVPAILRLPEVVQGATADLPDEEIAALNGALELAIEALDSFRAQEGATLIADIMQRISGIETLKSSLAPYESARTETIKNRIRENIESMKIHLDSNRLEQEMIYYIEKLDITEEKVRLQNHLDYFREVAVSEDNPGRKLGFITQEIGREINTLGSKSNEANMQQIVVRMKDELEKIKEQLLNIL